MGGELVRDVGAHDVNIVRLANTWLALGTAEGPKADKPNVYLAPPSDRSKVSTFIGIRVANIHEAYREWSAKGAQFYRPHTPPRRDPLLHTCSRRHLIEVGEATGVLGALAE